MLGGRCLRESFAHVLSLLAVFLARKASNAGHLRIIGQVSAFAVRHVGGVSVAGSGLMLSGAFDIHLCLIV